MWWRMRQALSIVIYGAAPGVLHVGDPVTVDGCRGRGVVVGRKGKRVIVQFRSPKLQSGVPSDPGDLPTDGFKVERDESFVHKL